MDAAAPSKDDRMMAEWARRIVQMLRDGQLVTNKWFTVTKTDSGTVVTFRWPSRRTTMKIKLSGVVDRVFLCTKASAGDDPGDLQIEMLPLGFGKAASMDGASLDPAPTYVTKAGPATANAWIDEMMDADPVYLLDRLIGFNTTIQYTVEVEEDE